MFSDVFDMFGYILHDLWPKGSAPSKKKKKKSGDRGPGMVPGPLILVPGFDFPEFWDLSIRGPGTGDGPRSPILGFWSGDRPWSPVPGYLSGKLWPGDCPWSSNFGPRDRFSGILEFINPGTGDGPRPRSRRGRSPVPRPRSRVVLDH